MKLEKDVILALLDQLRERDPDGKLFGASHHQYRLNEPVSKVEVEAFESRHGITLPEDYRYFLTEVGNGGAGPHYGLYSLGLYGFSDGRRSWEEEDEVGSLSEPFRLETVPVEPTPDRDGSNNPEEELGDSTEEEATSSDEIPQYVEDKTIIHGALPISTVGCGYGNWLVVQGEQRGFVCIDLRVQDGGMEPLSADGKGVTFAEWYMGWLNDRVTNLDRLLSEIPTYPRTLRQWTYTKEAGLRRMTVTWINKDRMQFFFDDGRDLPQFTTRLENSVQSIAVDYSYETSEDQSRVVGTNSSLAGKLDVDETHGAAPLVSQDEGAGDRHDQ